MRSWAARPLSRSLRAISRRWGGSSAAGGDGSAGQGKPAGSLRDEPILADFLAVGGNFTPSEEPSQTIAEPSKQSSSPEKALAVRRATVPAPQPASPSSVRERRLVAVALRQASVLQQAPASGSRPARLPLDAGGLRLQPRALPSLFVAAGMPRVAAEGLGEAVEPTASAGQQPARQTRPEGGPTKVVAGAVAATARGGLRAMRGRGQHPKELRQSMCRVLLADFAAQDPAEPKASGGSSAGTATVPKERTGSRPGALAGVQLDLALKYCARGEVASLAQFLGLVELQRASATACSQTDGSSPGPASEPTAEALEDAKAVRHRFILSDAKEQAVLGLFLDGQLSWPRVKPLLQRLELPLRPRSTDPAGSPGVETSLQSAAGLKKGTGL